MVANYPSDWGRRRRRVYKRDNYICQECGRRGGKRGDAELHAHHIVPLSKGGSNKLKNLKTLCKDCHAEAHSHMGAAGHRPQKGFWGKMYKKADSELNSFYDGCPNCGEPALKVRWERLKFRKKAKVLQCISCGAMYDERIKQDEPIERLELVRVSDVEQVKTASSATKQERKRYQIRGKMDQQSKAQTKFGVCPSCGESKYIRLKSGIFFQKFLCEACSTGLERTRLTSDWKMSSGPDELVGEAMSILEWEQIAIDRGGDAKSSKSKNDGSSGNQSSDERREDNNEDSGSQRSKKTKTSLGQLTSKKTDAHRISRDTWRGRAARVLDKDSWMDAHDVSQAITDLSDINYTISNSGASSVLSDMHRHDDVVRREKSSGRTKYEYQLREDAVVE